MKKLVLLLSSLLLLNTSTIMLHADYEINGIWYAGDKTETEKASTYVGASDYTENAIKSNQDVSREALIVEENEAKAQQNMYAEENKNKQINVDDNTDDVEKNNDNNVIKSKNNKENNVDLQNDTKNNISNEENNKNDEVDTDTNKNLLNEYNDKNNKSVKEQSKKRIQNKNDDVKNNDKKINVYLILGGLSIGLIIVIVSLIKTIRG